MPRILKYDCANFVDHTKKLGKKNFFCIQKIVFLAPGALGLAPNLAYFNILQNNHDKSGGKFKKIAIYANFDRKGNSSNVAFIFSPPPPWRLFFELFVNQKENRYQKSLQEGGCKKSVQGGGPLAWSRCTPPPSN